MRPKSPRIAVRAIIVRAERLLLVNAYPAGQSPLMCAPGGGVEPGSSLPDNLRREVMEETGLDVTVKDPCLVNEFHDPASGFHQVDIYFRCVLNGSADLDPAWQDPENIVTRRQWVTLEELQQTPHKPDSLAEVAFGPPGQITYDPLEPIVR